MNRRVRRTARADADIEGIAKWIARDSVDAALRWLDGLDEAMGRLAQTPGSGTERGELRAGMRSSPFGNYLIFFRPMRDGIVVVRVIHGARDYRRL